MRDAGLQNVTADIQQLDSNNSFISKLAFTYRTTNRQLHLKADNVTISYQAKQLRQGKIQTLLIDRLELRSDDIESAQLAVKDAPLKVEPLLLIAGLRDALEKYQLFDTIEIKQVFLHGEAFSFLDKKTFAVNGSTNNDVLATGIVFPGTGTGIDINHGNTAQIITQLSSEAFSMVLKTDNESLKNATSINLNIHNESIDGSYKVIMASLKDWLQKALQQDISLNNNIELVNGKLSFDFSDKDIIKSVITAKSDKVFFNQYRADAVELKVKLSSASENPGKITQILNGSYIKLGYIDAGDIKLTTSRLYYIGELAILQNGWNYDGGINWSPVNLEYDSRRVKFKSLTASIAASQDAIDVFAYITPDAVPGKFSFSLSHSMLDNSGSLSLLPDLPLNFNDEENSLGQLMMPWPYNFDLYTGTLKLSAFGRWADQQPMQANIVVDLDDAGGNVYSQLFSGLSFKHDLAVLPTLQSKNSTRLTISKIDSGIIISDLNSMVEISTDRNEALPRIELKRLNGTIFNGSFSSQALSYNLNAEENKFTINASDIDLSEIIKTQQLDDITATGKIDGSIPVKITKDGVFVDNGAFLNNMQSGTIRYNPKAGTEQLKQNPLTGIALDALKDFRYSHLAAGVNFTPEGTLSVSLQLKGISPELDTNRPVNLNINTEQNLLSLLKSLRYAQGISDSIDKQVRQQYEKQQ